MHFFLVNLCIFAPDYNNKGMYRIKEILDQKGLKAKDLASMMKVTPQYISGIIREQGSASVSVLAKIAKALNVPVASLFDDYISEKEPHSVIIDGIEYIPKK